MSDRAHPGVTEATVPRPRTVLVTGATDMSRPGRKG
jgi:hypothetical protein